MTLENVTNITGLFEIINQCKGKVELVTGVEPATLGVQNRCSTN